MAKPDSHVTRIGAPWPRMYAVVRTDLGDVPAGKLMGAAGHAFVGSFHDAHDEALDRAAMARAYAESEEHPKIVLGASRGAIVDLSVECQAAVVPHHVVRDFGRTVFNEPTLVAIGIGPITEPEYRALGLNKLDLYR